MIRGLSICPRGATRALAIVVAFLLAPLPASAGPLEDDADTIEACMTTAWPRDVLSLCAGVVANPCQAAAEGDRMTGIRVCLEREGQAWEILLGRLWPKMMNRAREIDAANETVGLGFDSAAETLEQAQRAWTVYRDSECRHNYASWGAGDFRNVAHAACMLDITARRSVDFHGKLMTGG